MVIKRGDIYYADLNPVIGSEQGGIRPVLIVQNNIGNAHSATVIILPISSAKKAPLPVHTNVGSCRALTADSTVLAEQIRTIDKKRLKNYVGSLDIDAMKCVDESMKISLGVN